MSPSSGLNNKTSKKPELCFPPAFMLVSCLAYSSTLKMEAICSSKTSVETQRTTWRLIPEDDTLHYGVRSQTAHFLHDLAIEIT
jgi:hypothetical protein